jgi:hypothetical protein
MNQELNWLIAKLREVGIQSRAECLWRVQVWRVQGGGAARRGGAREVIAACKKLLRQSSCPPRQLRPTYKSLTTFQTAGCLLILLPSSP